MNTEQERKWFESWYRQEHPHQVCEWVSRSKKHGSGFTNNHTKELWRVWQARAAECRVPEGFPYEMVAEVLDDYARALTDSELDGAGRYLPADIVEAADMIQSAPQPEQEQT